MVQALLLTVSSEVKPARITIANEEVGCQLSDIQKYLKKKTPLQIVGTYPWKGNTLYLFGYKEGKAGTENTHELPPPLGGEVLYGDIIVLMTKDRKSFAKPVAFKSEEYESFYTQMFEGIQDEGGDNEELEDEEEEDDEEHEEEEDDEVNEEEEAVFEENEEAPYIEEDVEEKEKDIKKKNVEEELPVLAVVRKKQTKAEKSVKSKKKELHNTPIHLGAELVEEAAITENATKEKQRIQTLNAITQILTDLTEEERNELEHHIFNASLLIADKKHIVKHWGQPLYVEIYKSLSRSVIGNMSPTNYVKNEALYKRYKDGLVSLSEIAHFNVSDLYPEIWKDLSIRQFEREKRQLEGNKSMATDQFQCKRCGKRECTYYELQTRSADEPMTIFIQCLNCGKHWRQ